MDKKIFFLSHSNKDEHYAKKLAKNLGEELCWLYQWEIKDTIFRFDRGIADSRVFVLFWSRNAAQSPWVEEEISQARYRSIREKGYRLVIIKLDEEPLPDYLAYRTYIEANIGLDNVIKKINVIKNDLTSKEALFGKQESLEYFQNRESELNNLNKLAFTESNSGIMILGLDGMGKTSFVRRSIYHLFPHLTPIWVDLRIASTPIRLLSSIAKPLSISIDLEEVGINPERLWINKIFPEIALSEKTFIIFDNFPQMRNSSENQIMERIIDRIITDFVGLNKRDNPNMIIISEKMPNLSNIITSKCGSLNISELESNFMVRALDYQLSYLYSGDYTLIKLEQIVQNMNGYPLAVGLVAARIAQHGIDAIIEDTSFIDLFFSDVARKLFSGIDLVADEKKMLVILSISSHPLNIDQLKRIFKGKWTIINTLIDYQIVDSSLGGYQIHNILRNYILNTISSKAEVLEAHALLARIFEAEWKKALKNSASRAEYGSLAYYHSLSSGKSSEAESIRKEYLIESMDALKELYRRHQYPIVLKYAEEIREIHKEFEPVVNYYYALSLYRSERAREALPIMQELVNKFPSRSNYHHSFGLIQRRLFNNNDAKKSFRKAIANASSKRDEAIGLSSLADIKCDEGQINEAKNLALKALSLIPNDPNMVAKTAKILSKSGENEEALILLRAALKKSPNDSHLHSQIGQILRELKLYKEALDHLEIASRNPSLAFTLTALADVYIELNNIEKAEKIIEDLPGDKMCNTSYLASKANILRLKKDLFRAERLIKRAIDLEPMNIVHYGILSQIKLDQSKNAILDQNKEIAFACLYAAEDSLNNGLKIDINDQALLSIKYSIETFKSKIGVDT